MRLLLGTVGSRGDVQPLLVLARELVRRGHHVVLAAPPNFRDASRGEPGLEFFPVGSDTAALIEEHRALAEASPLRSLPGQVVVIRREAERQIRDFLAYTRPADVVVAAGLAFGARTLADRLGATYVYLAYSLWGIRSSAHAPAALPLFGLPRLGNAALWAALVAVFDRALGGALARERRAHGLAPAAPWASIHGSRTLLAQDELLGVAPPDAKGYAGRVPALVSRAPLAPLPVELERFLQGDGSAARPPAVYLGFGSMPAVDRSQLDAAAVELARRGGARVVLFSADAERGVARLDERVLVVTETDHRALFPRMDLVVHHGGAGTTASALRAGVPQLVVPHIQDQFAHGRRIAELGLGPAPVRKAKLTAEALLDALRSSPRYRERARAVASDLAGQSGAAPAAEFLEQLGASHARR